MTPKWIALALVLGFQLAAHAAQTIGVGSASQVFDSVQYDEPFLPAQTGNPWTEIDKQLSVLDGKLPYTAAYLRSFYADGKTVWWFVDVTLKPPAAGNPPTDVITTGAREQAAANLGSAILVRKDIWSALSDDDKATLLVHEMLWSAVGGAIGDGTDIVLMSRYLLNPNLAGFSAINVMASLQQMAGASASVFSQWLAYDQSQQTTIPNFKVTAVAAGLINQLIVTTTAAGPYQGLELTVLRPNAAYSRIDDGGDEYFGVANGIRLKLNPSQLCTTLKYGGYGDWRLPTVAEAQGLDALNFLQTQYPSVGEVFARPSSIGFGNSPAVGVLASDGVACLEDDQTCEISDGFFTDLPYFCVRRP